MLGKEARISDMIYLHHTQCQHLEEEPEAAPVLAKKRLKGKQYQVAAEMKDKAKLESFKSETYRAKRTPSGHIPEVVIPRKMKKLKLASGDEAQDTRTSRPKRKVGSSSRVSEGDLDSDDAAGDGDSDYEDQDEDQGIESDDDVEVEVEDDHEDSDDPAEKKKSQRSKRPLPASSRSTTTDDMAGDQSSEEKVSKWKTKGKAKVEPKVTKGKARSKSDTEDDSMDVDDPPSPASASSAKKRKAAGSSGAPTKKRKREDTDPWLLGSDKVKRDWTQMRAPPLEVFHFARVVVDEYTYLGGKVHSMVTKLTADRRWVLSGTPPIHDFASVKTIAAHLNIHLGIDDGGEGRSAVVKKRIREQTSKYLKFLMSLSLIFLQRRNLFIPSVRFILKNGMPIAMNLDKSFWTCSSDRSVESP